MPMIPTKTPLSSKPSRRALLIGAASAGLALAMPTSPARAMSVGEASALIDRMVGEITLVINSGRSEATMLRDFESIFARYADVPIIARSALGVAARQASAAQLREFTVAFRSYLSRKYGRRFREFIGGRIEVTGAGPVKSFYEVTSTAYLRGSAPFEVRWHVSDKSGQKLFFNLIIEGVNMLATERTEIGAMLDRRRGNIDLLIEDLKSAG
jgi:phospholipid transport system substrate-binding protein